MLLEEVYKKFMDLKTELELKKFDFELDYNEGLKYVSDESLELAYLIIKNYAKRIEYDEEKNTYKFFCAMENICFSDFNTKTLLEKIKKDPKSMDGNSTAFFQTKKNVPLNRICMDCNFQKCPKHLAMYIYYLIANNKLKKKLIEREEFRAKNDDVDWYTYKWEFGNILRIIPDDMFEFCYKIAKNKQVYVSRYLENGSVHIYKPFTCQDLKVINNDIDLIPKKERKAWTSLSRSSVDPTLICNDYVCSLKGCPHVVAGIIYYLLDKKRQDILFRERKYYKEHKEEMDKELEKLISNQAKKKSEKIEKASNELAEYSSKIDKFDKLLGSLTNPNQKNLHCVIEGDDEDERINLIIKMCEFLFSYKGIPNENKMKLSLQNLAAGTSHYSNFGIHKGFDSDNHEYMGANSIKYNSLLNDYIYVITDIAEFIKDYGVYANSKSDNAYVDLRKKQYNHVIELITNLHENNYLILSGSSKEIDSLLELDPRLQYLYQNERYKVPEVSLDDAFNVYEQYLNTELFKIIKEKEDENKNKFKEYVSLNKNFIPFSNRELAIYLAMYSNSRGAIEFPDNIYQKETVEEALANIVGLAKVKEKVKEFEKYMLFKVKAEANGLKLASTNMHMIFTGNPGTGKTTIARIMAKMLYDMGIIKENKLIEAERKDLVGEYIGQTAPKTSEVIDKAMGGVLFIDEAYSLASKVGNDYGKEAIATLIKAMEDHKDDLVVIFAGYKDEMKEFMDMNAGIVSRIGYTFDFDDYSTDELLEIFHKKITKMGFEYEDKCDDELKKLFKYFSKRKSFGNGRFVDKVLQEVLLKHAIQQEDDSVLKEIKASDIPSIQEVNNSSEVEETIDELLANVIGLNNLKEKIKEFQAYVEFVKEAEKNNLNIPGQNMHMIFTGNPGTGKTTIARIMAKILFNAGILQENKLIEVERKDLIGEYIGQTAPKTAAVIEKAMGGILFIDEAYSLAQKSINNDFGKEAIATLIKAMEDHKGEFICIFAGYKKEMGDFLEMNSGISSRIGYTFNFEDYSREELAEILYKKIEKSNLKIENPAKKEVEKIMNYFCKVENIGNGRFSDKVYQAILLKHAMNRGEKLDTIVKADIPSISEITETIFNGDSMINPDLIDDKALRKTAIHEIGHAMLRFKLLDTPGIMKITINPEGNGALGYVLYKTQEGTYVNTKSALLNRIKVSLAGMASEETFIGEFANGNTSDLEKATSIANNMVTRYGMSDLGYGQIKNTDGELGAKVQEEINKILDQCYKETKQILKEEEPHVLELVDFLLKEKEITEEQFIDIYNGKDVKAASSKKTSSKE